jgi:hypothetical protein
LERRQVEQAFQVDLRGVVDLLSHHLYASPRVYVRELLQNAVDTITARRFTDPGAEASVSIEPLGVAPGGVLAIHDNGVGLTEPEVHELLATIGRSSKRDDLGFARHEFLGQFGIGLLSCFLVADEVRVTTRSARGGPTVAWTGFADGRYTVTAAGEERPEAGTTVALQPRPGMQHWLGERTVTDLATMFGSLLREFRRRHPTIRYTATTDEFRELTAVAEAQGIGLVNGGLAYDVDVMKRLRPLDPARRSGSGGWTPVSWRRASTHPTPRPPSGSLRCSRRRPRCCGRSAASRCCARSTRRHCRRCTW